MPDKAESYEHRPGGDLKNSRGSAGPSRQVPRLSPVTAVIAALVLTIVLLMGLAWQVWQSYLDHKKTQEQAVPIQAHMDQIIHFDEVLTMAANMAAETGDPQWEKRYRNFEPQLDVAIKTLERLVPETFYSAAAIQTEEANVKLVEMENQAFEMVGHNRLDEAQAILSGDDYRRQKKAYSDGMQRIAADLENYLTADLDSNRKSALIALVSVLLGLPLLALIWLWVLQNIQRHLKELNHVEMAIRESEERYRSLTDDVLDSSELGLFILGADFKVVWINRAIERFLGLQRDQVIGKDKKELIRTQISDVFEDPQEFIHKVISTYDNNTYMERFECHVLGDGTRQERWLEHRSLPIQSGLYAGGRMEHYIDITDRKLAEEQVENLARFPSENPSPVLRIARDGTLLYANDASVSILEEWGCREGQSVPDEWRGIISEAIDTGQEKKTEIEHARRVLSFSIAPVIEAGYANLYCTDTTERKRAEESLKLRFDLEELLTSISTDFIGPGPDEIDDGIDRAMKSIIDAICVDRGYIFLYSTDGRTMDNTHEGCRPGVPPHKDRLHDVPVEKFPWFDRRIKNFEPIVIDSVAGLTEEAAAEKERLQYEDIQSLLCMPMVSRGGLLGFVGFDTVFYEVKWAEETMTFVKILGTVFANAIERKRSGQERERLLKTLAAKNEELQSIVYVASHDLKSPLVNIEGFSGELAASCEQIEAILHGDKTPAQIQSKLATLLEEDIPESLSFIRAGTTKMQALLKGLLEVSRVGTDSFEIATIDMNEMMHLIITGMQFQITSSGADVTVDDLPDCTGDKNHINQVFTNLLDNAVKYLDPKRKGVIHVFGRTEGGDSIYCVHDNGFGIASAHQPKIFEMFHRLEPNGEVKGEGLGLTIVRRILDREKGKIWVESEPGKGSRFFVSLPRA